MVKNLAAVQDMWVQSLGQEDLLEKYSCLENSLDRGAWWTAVRGMAELDTTERWTLSLFLHWILLTTWRLGHQSHTHAKTRRGQKQENWIHLLASLKQEVGKRTVPNDSECISYPFPDSFMYHTVCFFPALRSQNLFLKPQQISFHIGRLGRDRL